jgi:hypothetical protein
MGERFSEEKSACQTEILIYNKLVSFYGLWSMTSLLLQQVALVMGPMRPRFDVDVPNSC